MIVALEYLSETALSDSFLNFESVCNMVVDVADVLALVVVEAAVLGAIRGGEWLATILTLKNVQVVDGVVLQDLRLLVVEQVFREVHDNFARLHWELYLKRTFLVFATKKGLAGDGRV